MNQPIMNDALIHALKGKNLDVNADEFKNALKDATLLVCGQETDAVFSFELVEAEFDGRTIYALDTYTNWAQLTGDETVFPLHFQQLLNSMLVSDEIEGIMLNRQLVLPKNYFDESNQAYVAGLDENDAEIEEHLIPALAARTNRAYIGKMITDDGQRSQILLVINPWNEENVAALKASWVAYAKEHNEPTDIKIVSEDSEAGKMMMEHSSPVFNK